MNIGDKVQLKTNLIMTSQPHVGIITELIYKQENIFCKIKWEDDFSSTIHVKDVCKIKSKEVFNSIW